MKKSDLIVDINDYATIDIDTPASDVTDVTIVYFVTSISSPSPG